jgi:type IV pilus assembly protein PilA
MMLKKLNDNKGFTLIELMIVIAIIGILAAIAIPQFSAYRRRSYNSSAKSDARNIATAQEAYYVDNSTYCGDVTVLTGTTYGYMQSENVNAQVSGSASSYTITTYHTSGNETYTLNGPGGVIGD